MKKIIKKLPPKAVTAMLAASGLLLLSGSIGGTRAALTYYSDNYASQMNTKTIGVALEEKNPVTGDEGENNGETKEWQTISHKTYTGNDKYEEIQDGELLANMLGDGESLKIGKKYEEELRVRNSGEIGEYVRVTIYKYWTDTEMAREDAKKDNRDNILSADAFDEDKKHNQSLVPDVIKLELDLEKSEDGSCWIEDTDARTANHERTVLYYNTPISAGEVTKAFTKSLKIDEWIRTKVTETESKNGNLTLIKSVYDYDGKQFIIEVEVDAVQDHNAEDAILSAWGRDVTIGSDGRILSLNKMTTSPETE